LEPRAVWCKTNERGKGRKSFVRCNNWEPGRVSVIAHRWIANAEVLIAILVALQKRPVNQYPRVKDAADYKRVSNYRLFVI
jgi:hypothetical protein